jgi:hypothetical protein
MCQDLCRVKLLLHATELAHERRLLHLATQDILQCRNTGFLLSVGTTPLGFD